MKALAALPLFLLIGSAAAPTPDIRYFRFQRAVDLPQNATGQTCVVLDAQTFSHAASGLDDLRLYRGTDETPYVIHNAAPSQASPSTIPPLNLGTRRGKTVFDAAMPEGEYSDLQLNLTGQNFLATVTVSGGQNANAPATRIGSYTIFDLSAQRLGRSTVLHLPRSNFRSLHFEIAGPIPPEHIQSIAASSAPLVEPRYLSIQTVGQFVRKNKTSVAEFTLPPNVPIDRIAFTPAALPVNFSREIQVEVSETKAPQAQVASSVGSTELLRIHHAQDGRRIDEENLSVETSRTTYPSSTNWTITMQNGDDPPVAFVNVQAQMLECNLCFEAAPGARYALYYGDNTLAPPHYDYASWFAYQPNAAVATLGAEQGNAAFQQRPDNRPFTERHPALLWAALILVVLLLGVVALRTARRGDQPMPRA